MEKIFQYDVTLSFAGEDRKYVEQVAQKLKAQEIKVHYDEFNEIDAWGKNLPENFDRIYRKDSRFCVMFISGDYAKKAWPTFEKRSALDREVIENGYILPARFDDTEVLGIPPSKSYIDLRKYSPNEFAELIIKKISKTQSIKNVFETTAFRRPKITKSFDPYKESQVWVEYLIKELESRCEDSGISFSHFLRDGKQCLRFVINGKPVYSINIKSGSLYLDQGLSFSYAHGEMSAILDGINAFGEFDWNKDRECIVLKLNDFSVFSRSSSERQEFTKLEFLDYIWEKVCNATEEKM